MAKPSISMPDELLAKFDAIHKEKMYRKEVEMGEDRSPAIRRLIERHVEEEEQRLGLEEGYWTAEEDEEGNPKMAMAAD